MQYLAAVCNCCLQKPFLWAGAIIAFAKQTLDKELFDGKFSTLANFEDKIISKRFMSFHAFDMAILWVSTIGLTGHFASMCVLRKACLLAWMNFSFASSL